MPFAALLGATTRRGRVTVAIRVSRVIRVEPSARRHETVVAQQRAELRGRGREPDVVLEAALPRERHARLVGIDLARVDVDVHRSPGAVLDADAGRLSADLDPP